VNVRPVRSTLPLASGGLKADLDTHINDLGDPISVLRNNHIRTISAFSKGFNVFGPDIPEVVVRESECLL